MKSTGAALPDIVVVMRSRMRQASLAQARVREGEVLLQREFAHNCTCRLDASKLPTALSRIADRTCCSTERVGTEEHELVMDFGHCSLIAQGRLGKQSGLISWVPA
jgi:hypothetical protein